MVTCRQGKWNGGDRKGGLAGKEVIGKEGGEEGEGAWAAWGLN